MKAAVLSPVFRRLYGSRVSRERDVTLRLGVNLIGYPRADVGDGEFTRQVAQSLLAAGVEFGLYDYNPGVSLSRKNDLLAKHIHPNNPYGTNIFNLKPDSLEASILTLGKLFVAGRYNISYCVWELSQAPAEWETVLEFFDEVWCPSRFVQEAVASETNKPVHYLPVSVDFPIPCGYERDHFGLPETKFLFLFVFDFKSYSVRKNPLACVSAFTKAFPRGNEPVGLVIKSMDGEKYPKEYQTLLREAARDSRVISIDAVYKPQEVWGLMQVCDAFVSLHRTEGFGYCIAQSMLLGKPVIATGYSGNIDFTRPDNSCLIDYKLIEVKKSEYPFAKGQVWADPDVEQAANCMQRLVEDKVYRNMVAEAGCSYIRTHHSTEAVGKIYRNRLHELGLLED